MYYRHASISLLGGRWKRCVSAHIYVICMYSQPLQESMDHQPGKTATPDRGQLTRESVLFLIPVRTKRLRTLPRETDSAVPSRVSLLILHTQTESDAEVTEFLPLAGTVPIYLHRQPPSGQSLLEFIRGRNIAYRSRLLPRVRSCPQGSSSNGWCFLRDHLHGPVCVRLYFPTATVGMLWTFAIDRVSETVFVIAA